MMMYIYRKFPDTSHMVAVARRVISTTVCNNGSTHAHDSRPMSNYVADINLYDSSIILLSLKSDFVNRM